MKTLQVVVIVSSKEGVWYQDMIGRVFPVFWESTNGLFLIVKNGNEKKTVRPEDAIGLEIELVQGKTIAESTLIALSKSLENINELLKESMPLIRRHVLDGDSLQHHELIRLIKKALTPSVKRFFAIIQKTNEDVWYKDYAGHVFETLTDPMSHLNSIELAGKYKKGKLVKRGHVKTFSVNAEEAANKSNREIAIDRLNKLMTLGHSAVSLIKPQLELVKNATTPGLSSNANKYTILRDGHVMAEAAIVEDKKGLVQIVIAPDDKVVKPDIKYLPFINSDGYIVRSYQARDTEEEARRALKSLSKGVSSGGIIKLFFIAGKLKAAIVCD